MITRETLTELFTSTNQFRIDEISDEDETVLIPTGQLKNKPQYDSSTLTLYIDGIIIQCNEIHEISIETNEEQTALIVYFTTNDMLDPYYKQTWKTVIPIYTTKEVSVNVIIEDTIIGFGGIDGKHGK